MSTQVVPPVVVGFDESEPAAAAVTWAARVAASQDAPLVVLHATDQIRYVQQPGTAIWDPQDVRDAALQLAERGAARAREVAPDLEVSTASSLASGALALESLSADARLIVVGNSGHGRVAGIILGSTAFHVASRATCPVVVVPAGDLRLPGPHHRVCVATDGSPSGTTAVRHAAEVAARYGAPLQVITAWERVPYDRYGLIPPIAVEPVDLDGEVERAAERIADEAAEQARADQPGLQVTTKVSEGRPVDVIAEGSEGAATLVVGARGRGDLKSLLLGSTSRAVLHLATCPVEIVR